MWKEGLSSMELKLRDGDYLPDGRGISYGEKPVVPDQPVRVDDDLILWLTKSL